MKRILFKIIILAAVFVGSLAIFMGILNHREVVNTKSSVEASLPVLYMREGSRNINRMYGYRQEVQEASMRESLTLLPTDRTLTVVLQPYENEIAAVEYQLSSLEDGTVLENGRIKSFSQEEGLQSASFQLQTAVSMGQEYMLRFAVQIGNDTVYYYTRIVQRNGQNLEWYLAYAENFYQNCLDGNLTEEMLSQLETERSSVTSSLHTVTLKSDSEQITWGNLEPTLEKKAVPTVLEINETTVSLRLDYLVSAQEEDAGKEYYTVSEYYRMRRNQDAVVLLDYERTVTQCFDGNLPVLTQKGLNLGITGKDVKFVASDNADIVAFAQAGELWLYDRGSNKATNIYSLWGADRLDERTENMAYDISVSTVSDEGNTTFVVYGYRTSGVHEGKLGISVYRYTVDDNITRELLFIPLQDSYQAEKQGLSRLAYVNSQEQCFFYYNDTIYTVQLSDDSVSVLQENLDWQSVSASDSQMLVSWGEESNARVQELNLESGETAYVEAPEGDSIRVLGYMGEELVYGLAHTGDCYTDSAGNEIFPMYRICVRSSDGQIQKDYQADGVYITDVEIDGNRILMQQAQKENGQFKATAQEQLVHYAPEEDSAVDVSLTVSDRQGTQVNLDFSTPGETANLFTQKARYPAESSVQELDIENMTYGGNAYAVYAHGGLYALYTRLSQAITAADNEAGVVLNAAQQYVWERGNVSSTAMLDITSLPEGLLSAPIAEETIAQAVGEAYNVWNLSGCSLSAIRYQLSNGYAVVGQWSEGETRLIVGYDLYNIWYYDAASGEARAVAFEDAEAAFASCGNIFISYGRK